METKGSTQFLSNKSWDRYKNIINGFMDNDAARQVVIWAKAVDQLLTHGEDSIQKYFKKPIEALCYYNAFRNWPLNRATTTGELDEENLSIMISGKYLRDHGFMNNNNYWNFNWAMDRFEINGVVYRPTGDTQVAQAKDEALVFMVVLKRDRDSKLIYVE